MFMGSGAVTFAMVDRVKYVIANDKDEDIFNMFMVIKERKEELENAIRMFPIHNKLFQYWKKQKEHDPVWKATRFLFLSNFSYLGRSDTLHLGQNNCKGIMLNEIKNAFDFISFVQFINYDFRDVLKKIAWRHERDLNKVFIYADPPYIETGNNYTESFTEDDTRDLFSILAGSGIRFAVSEFRNHLVMALAEEHGLHVTSLGERRNLKNRREEIFITNYEPVRQQVSLFDETMNKSSFA
jgi:DNA adenine methylase